jgi:cytochrome c553
MWLMSKVYLPVLLLFIFSYCKSSPAQPQPTPGKLWNSDDERLRFMLKMSHHIVAPIQDECIERVLNRMKTAEKSSFLDSDFYQLGYSSLMTQAKRPAVPAATAATAADVCQNSLMSCGSCHLPRQNNCNYRLSIKDKGEFSGKVIAEGDKLTFQPDHAGASASEIAPNEILRSEWLNGGDDITTWWNFKKLGAKGRIVKKMMALSAKNNVGCTNCHMQHGNFKLNENGKLFDTTGEVKRLVPLAEFVK